MSATGRLFFTIHPESRAPGPRLYEWVKGKAVPFPDAQQQTKLFHSVLGAAIDGQARLWLIDHGDHGTKGAQLLAFDINTKKLVHKYIFPSKDAPLGSFLQDLQIAPDGAYVYIADVSFWRKSPGIVMYDVKQRF